MATVDRRRQNRLWLSCVACRTRKAKCDRARPCRRCVQAGSADRCHYDVPAETSRLVAPGQHVFAVEAAKATEAAKAAKAAKAVDSLSLASDESAPRSPAHGFQPPSVPLPSTETGPLAPLQLLWHGSRAVDTYVEPLHERTISTPKEVVFGENDATVYWGRSHETNFVPRITDAAKLLLEPDSEDNVSTLYHVERSTRPGETIPVREHDPELMALLPTRADADRLVDVYIHTFETYYKIIHIPTFLRDYARLWDADPAVSVFGPPHFLAQLLSICAIGSGLITVGQQDPTTGTERDTGARMTSQWIEAVRLWLFKQNPRMQMTLGHLQAHLLMLVAGDTHWIKIDRSWISSGMLIRNAVSAGLHREPADFTRISPFYAELRRRLWYAIIEFDLQASFAKGRTPSIHDEDYDCRPPAAIVSDDMFNEGVTEADIDTVQLMHTPLPLYVCLAKSISLRTRVCRLVNGITLTSAYEQVLRLDAELKAFLVDAAAAIQTEPDTTKRILLSIITQRTTIALHAPFLSRTLHDPRYLYSRQVCVETATTVLTEALSLLDDCSEPKANQAFDMVNNICRCEIANSVFILCRELLTQVIERRRRQSSMTLMPSSQPKEQQQVMAHLVESTSHATAAICKPDIVSQRTCAWMQLSAELSRAAIGDDATTVISMKESIGRSIQAYRASIQQAEPDSTIGSDAVDAMIGSVNMVDEDYFNLFWNLNNFDMANQWL